LFLSLVLHSATPSCNALQVRWYSLLSIAISIIKTHIEMPQTTGKTGSEEEVWLGSATDWSTNWATG